MHLLPVTCRADEPRGGGGARAGLVVCELALRGEREGQQQLEDLQQLRVAAQLRPPARARAAAPRRVEHAVEEYRVEPLPRAEQAQRLAARAVEHEQVGRAAHVHVGRVHRRHGEGDPEARVATPPHLS